MTLDIDRRAIHWADRTAIVDYTSGERLSYADFDERADRAAHRLAAAGVEPGDAVVVLSRNRPELLALFFGTHRIGATLAPISHRLAPETATAVAGRIDPALVLYEDRFGELAGPISTEIGPAEAVTLDEWVTLEEQASRPPDGSPQAEARAGSPPPLYLHTGGTTGVPKVVEISERQIEWNCITEVAAWGLGKETVSPILLPMFHTGGWLLLTLPTLYVGGRILLQREFDPGEALRMIEEGGATQVFAVAAIFRAMAEHDEFAETEFSTVEWFISGGGPTPPAVMDAYRDRGETFAQGYGLTEGGPNNLYVDPTRENADEIADRHVGRPFPDCEARIVDEDGQPLEAGAVGELELAGPVTAERYLETEDGTFEAEDDADGKWVSTGDLAVRSDEGDYAIVGRTDNMFISGGENVFPETIEGALERHEDVETVGVIPIAHDRWGQVPKAVVVPATRAEPDADDLEAFADDLEAFARENLTDYEIPHEFAFAEELPLSGPGKIDRDALGEQYHE